MQISEKRLAANRANAARSTGPRSDEGKARSAQNALKHGITAAKFTVPDLDEPDLFVNLRADAIALYQPEDQQELFAVERVVLAQIAILRCAALEASMYNAAFEEPPATDGDTASAPSNRASALGLDFQRNTRSWTLLLRYQAQTDRQYRRAVEDLYRLKQLHADLPNEPIVDTEPIQTAPLSAAAAVPVRPASSPADHSQWQPGVALSDNRLNGQAQRGLINVPAPGR